MVYISLVLTCHFFEALQKTVICILAKQGLFGASYRCGQTARKLMVLQFLEILIYRHKMMDAVNYSRH